MILYDEHQKHGLEEFGIGIPIRDSRATRTFAHLRQHPTLGRCVDAWHVRPTPEPMTRDDLLRVHAPDYVDRLFSDALEDELLRTYELVADDGSYHRYNPETASRPIAALFDRILAKASGTWQCGRLALQHGFCFFFGGGMHHGHYDFGHGFCPINDIAIAVRRLQAEGRIRTAWVIDIDAHKGDGTAALTHADATITTLSIHMARGWPLDGSLQDARGRRHPAVTPSDIDIPVDAGEEGDYLARLSDGLQGLAPFPEPDLAVVVAGADPYAHDELPSTQLLRLTLDQLMARDRLVYDFFQERRIPMAWLMAGGYGDRVWEVYSQFLERVLLERYGKYC